MIKKYMEKIINPQILDKEALILASYAEKKGRESFGHNPFTCYAVVDSPGIDLPNLTASLLEELTSNCAKALTWTRNWDKTIVSINPSQKPGCYLLETDSLRGKNFVAVSTARTVDGLDFVKDMPGGSLAEIAINDQKMTIDAFLICYFHMVNELIWDIARENSDGNRVDVDNYSDALELVSKKGFVVNLLSEAELLLLKRRDANTSLRIYGSGVNKNVPQILGAVIRK